MPFTSQLLTDFVVIEGLLARLGAGTVEPCLEVRQEESVEEGRTTPDIVLTDPPDTRVDFLEEQRVKTQ